MGKDSGIEWTDHTFNPWIGCTKVSAGCKNCYAETYGRRFGIEWGPDGGRRRTSAANWRKPLQWNSEAKRAGVRRRVFCASLADVFEDRTELDEMRADLWRLIEQCPDLDWLVLTKRPENIMSKIPSIWIGGIPNQVWIGTTVENQKAADKRIPELFRKTAKNYPMTMLWVTLPQAPATALLGLSVVLAARTPGTLGVRDGLAIAVFLAAVAGEYVADEQTRRFRADPANKSQVIGTGLWAWSRHPNYFGEIVLWVGVALIALPVLQGWQLVTLVSPVFVALLLTRVSGVTLLERKVDATWGGQPDYEAYKAATPVLVPRPPRAP